MRNQFSDGYFEWLFELVCAQRYSNDISFRKLLTRLHEIEFIYTIPNDANRAEDGKDLRYRYAITHGYEDSYEDVLSCLDGPCSVLEMMVALSVRCEENIMDDPILGDRTRQWFWDMIVNLGLGSMHDGNYDAYYIDKTVDRFLYREYEANGKGGLFTIHNCKYDLRLFEIWYQLCWYLDTIV